MTDSLPTHSPLYRNIRRLYEYLHPRVTHNQLRWVAYPHAPAALPLGGPQSPSGRFGEDVCRESNPDHPDLASLIRNELS